MDTTDTGLELLSVLRAGWEGNLGYGMTFGTLLRMVVLVILPGSPVMLSNDRHRISNWDIWCHFNVLNMDWPEPNCNRICNTHARLAFGWPSVALLPES